MTDRGRALVAPYTLLGLCLAGTALALLGAVVALGADVRASGELLSDRPPVDRVELFGAITLYVDQRTSLRSLGSDLAISDVVNAGGFAALAVTAFLAAAFREFSAGASDRLWRFYFLLGLGAAFLSIDEIYTLHETFGHNVEPVTALPLVSHADDFFVVLFGLAGAVFCVWYRQILLEHRVALTVLCLGGAIFAAAAAVDLGTGSYEEELEALGSVVVYSGFAMLVLQQFAHGRFTPPLEVHPASNGAGASGAQQLIALRD